MARLTRRERPPAPPGEQDGGAPADDAAAEASEVPQALAEAADAITAMANAARRTQDALEAAARPTDNGRDRVGGQLLRALVENARQIHSEAEELRRRVGAARRRIAPDAPPASRTGERAAGGGPGEQIAPGSVEPSDAPQNERPPQAQDAAESLEPPSAGVRLLVSQMAAVGASRLEIEERLREDFGIVKARAVVAHVLDPKADSES